MNNLEGVKKITSYYFIVTDTSKPDNAIRTIYRDANKMYIDLQMSPTELFTVGKYNQVITEKGFIINVAEIKN